MNSNLKKKPLKTSKMKPKQNDSSNRNFDRFEELANRAVEILSKMTNLKQ